MRDEIHRASGGVAAEQGALRSTQNLNALQIVELGRVQIRDEGDLIEMGGNPRFGRRSRDETADTANGKVEAAEVRRRERHARRVHLQVGRCDDLLVFDHPFGQRADRKRYALSVLRDSLRGHYDLFKLLSSSFGLVLFFLRDGNVKGHGDSGARGKPCKEGFRGGSLHDFPQIVPQRFQAVFKPLFVALTITIFYKKHGSKKHALNLHRRRCVQSFAR